MLSTHFLLLSDIIIIDIDKTLTIRCQKAKAFMDFEISKSISVKIFFCGGLLEANLVMIYPKRCFHTIKT